ncbi:MAG TPA: cyclopropane-fatty-acyl-phospholipid synthase family protein [Hyphomicrobiaceae bacterium]|nr:cyclopropane-fatty-acyl-phospholipid synthase family protein [Hyphomicrobiaceae bacterium]
MIGPPTAECDTRISVRSHRFFWQLLRGGALGIAESFMDGHFDTDDLRAVFDFYLANEQAITRAYPRFNATRGRDRLFHRLRRNTRAGSRRNIAEHYDLGNAFYRLWLDPSMLYSSAIYRAGAEPLETAQRYKVERIVSALELSEGHSLLEIGCGWGALAEAAARSGARVRGITISAQQLVEARERIARAHLDDRAEITFEDYRDTTGTFDRIVSIEMIEAVGEENWPLYFRTLSDRLNAGGSAVVQAITIHEGAFEQYRQNPDFIQRYIFPGGMLPTVGLMRARAAEAGLAFETIEEFGASYARTLAEWRRRFEAAWPRIASLGFDERFRRMWLYYLIYCEVGFDRGLIDVGLYRLRKRAG